MRQERGAQYSAIVAPLHEFQRVSCLGRPLKFAATPAHLGFCFLFISEMRINNNAHKFFEPLVLTLIKSFIYRHRVGGRKFQAGNTCSI